jgi:hypothetical protein
MTDVKQPEGRKPVVENAVLHTPIVIESPCIRMVGKDGSVHVSCSHAAALAASVAREAKLREVMRRIGCCNVAWVKAEADAALSAAPDLAAPEQP